MKPILALVGLLAVHALAVAQPNPVPLPPAQTALRMEVFEKNRAEILQAAEAALRVYDAQPPAGWRQFSIARRETVFGASQTVLMLRRDDASKLVEIAIRGTASLDDMVFNIDHERALDARTGVQMHSGFKRLADDVSRFLASTAGLTGKGYRFRLYGHSLGGAIASIVAMHLHQDSETVEALITFGAPRFTSNEGARRYQVLNDRSVRVVRCDDVVPFLPAPRPLGFSTGSYEATGHVFLLLKPPAFDYSRNVEIERDFVHQLRLELESGRRGKLAHGHRMATYLKALGEYPAAGRSENDPNWFPVFYSIERQALLCPYQGG